MRILYAAGLWTGSTALQRLRAFERVAGTKVEAVPTADRYNSAGLVERAFHRFRRPLDTSGINERLLRRALDVTPDAVFVDNLKVIAPRTIKALNDAGIVTAFYSPDDIVAAHNSSRQLEATWTLWSVVFTTKSFNVPELGARGAQVQFVENAFDPDLHAPLDADNAGREFETFDVVFAGAVEMERRNALNGLAEAGYTVLIHGFEPSWGRMHVRVTLRPPVWGAHYSRAMHHGKIALCFLRKLNRDRVTTRSVEIPAMGRPMVAERTEGHDRLFQHGREYVGFVDQASLLDGVHSLLSNEERRRSIGAAGRERCLRSDYSTNARAREMLTLMLACRDLPSVLRV